jgi:hypothetical protein
MNPCDCCDKRFVNMGLFRCLACFYPECMLCSQHCQSVGANPAGLDTEPEIDLPELPVPRGLRIDVDDYPEADTATVVMKTSVTTAEKYARLWSSPMSFLHKPPDLPCHSSFNPSHHANLRTGPAARLATYRDRLVPGPDSRRGDSDEGFWLRGYAPAPEALILGDRFLTFFLVSFWGAGQPKVVE